MDPPQFVLKTTPPRAARTALARPRMGELWARVRDRSAVAVVAPRGFGKTMLLIQWRRLWLERGALCAWVSLDEQDDPDSFARVLFYALRAASGRATFDTIAAQYAGQVDRYRDALTGLLSGIAALATPTVLMLDDAERLPDATAKEALGYLLHNSPANLQVVVGSRQALALPTAEMLARGELALVRTDDLRFDLDESIRILRNRLGERIGLDDCARLHESTEGWPIGLQLAAASVEPERDLHRAIASLSARHGDIERYFLESMFAHLPRPLDEFLTRIAILDLIAPELCDAVVGGTTSHAMLETLATDTPVLIAAEQGNRMRLHALARDFLLGRFERLPPAERASLHGRAAQWLAEHEHFDAAASHALAAGDEALAQSYARRCLYSLVMQGRLGEVREWLGRFPTATIDGDHRLRLTAAWSMALGDEPARAAQIAESVSADATASPDLRHEAAYALACAEAFLDRPGRIPAVLDPWKDHPVPPDNPALVVARANDLAFVALVQGKHEEARSLLGAVPAGGKAVALALGHSVLIAALSHLWDGNPGKAEAVLRPALVRAEHDAGRRSVLAAMFAGTLAAAVFEQGNVAAAAALLAGRLDVVERTGEPDVILLAHRTLAYLGLDEGDERRALEVLDNLRAIGESTHIPRLVLHGLAEAARIHALRARHQTAKSLIDAMEALGPVFAQEDYAIYAPHYRMVFAIANAYVALARRDPDAAEVELRLAERWASQLHRGRETLVVKVLQAVVAHVRGDPAARSLLAEARGLAALRGLSRAVGDAHPIALAMEAADRQSGPAAANRNAAVPTHAPPSPSVPRSVASQGGLLTPKEAEVLQLLDNGLSNKQIARTMEISDETVKWHVKNLFAKLSAGTRKHAVDRARLLGLLVAA